MRVGCDNPDCTNHFTLQPGNIIELRTVDEDDNEMDWIPREHAFICAECIDRFSVTVDEDEED